MVDPVPAVAGTTDAQARDQLAISVGIDAIGPVRDLFFSDYGGFSSSYKQHNAALKYFREKYENPDDPSNSPSVLFHHTEPTAVAVIDHAKKKAGNGL